MPVSVSSETMVDEDGNGGAGCVIEDILVDTMHGKVD